MFLQSAVSIAVTLLIVPPGQRPAEAANHPPAPIDLRELSPQETQRFLTQVRQKLSSMKTLRADFIQERRMAAFIDTLTAKGTCYFMAPGKIRWELREPYRSALVFSEGKVAKFLYEDDRLRKLNPVGKGVMKQVLQMIALWLHGDFEGTKEFFDLQVLRGPVFILRLEPRHKQMAEMIREIELTMDADSKHIKKVTIRENRGDQIIITFVHEELNVDLDEALFAVD